MLSYYLDGDICHLGEHISKIKRGKAAVVALQGAPRLSEEEIDVLILKPLDYEYNVFRGDILHSNDNLLLVRWGPNKARLIRDTEANRWMLESNVSMCGVMIEPVGADRPRQLVFSIFVEDGANEGDVINNAYFIRKILTIEKLSPSNLVLLYEFVDETYTKVFNMILDIDTNTNTERRSTRGRSNG